MSQSKSLLDRIVRAGIVVGFAHLILKFAGLLATIFMVRALTTEQYEMIYVVSFGGVIYTLFLIGEEVLGPAFLPLFMEKKEKESEEDALSFASLVLTVQLLILLIVASILFCFPAAIASFMLDFTVQEEPEKFDLAVKSIRILSPAIIFLSLGSTTYMILNGYKKFFLAAFGDATWKLCVALACGVILVSQKLEWSWMHAAGALYAALLIGSVGKLITHLIGMIQQLRKLRPNFKFMSPDLKAMAILMLPLIAGIVLAKYRDIFNNVQVLSAVKQEGLLQANDLGRKLYASIHWLVPFTLQIALFPFLCELAGNDNKKKTGEVLWHSAKMMLVIFIPGAVILASMSEPITAVLFGSKNLSTDNLHWTALAMSCYLFTLPAAAVEAVVIQGYFAQKKMLSITIIGLACSLLSVLISYVGIKVYDVEAQWAIIFVAGGFGVSRLIKSCIMVAVLNRAIPLVHFKPLCIFLTKACLLAAIVGGGSFWAVDLIQSNILGVTEWLDAGKIKVVLVMSLHGGIIGILYLIIAHIIGLKEPWEAFLWVKQKIKKTK
ncbi:MAG: hypothetical protein MK193_11320 [Lentisphaeria bacterium]|nr:hypothetical protein [Lentisphaeria bacterium]